MAELPQVARAAVASTLPFVIAGCVPVQSSLHPRGPAADHIALLWWGMLAVAGLVSLLVTVLAVLAVRRRRRAASTAFVAPVLHDDEAERRGTRWLVYGGIVLPVSVLVVLFLVTAVSMRALTPPPRSELEIEVVARQWWWDIRYHHQRSGTVVRSANELHIPVGVPVRVTLSSRDVIHSFWVPSLNGKLDAVPGQSNVTWLQADTAGVYRGQCAEFCGLQHANMGMEVVAHAPEDWVQWFVREREPARPPTDTLARAGLRYFETRGCAMCHRIAGTRALAEVAPDLTHFGSRRTIAAATRPNVRGHLAGWIADPHGIKPGTHMPSMNLSREELLAVVQYLEGLR